MESGRLYLACRHMPLLLLSFQGILVAMDMFLAPYFDTEKMKVIIIILNSGYVDLRVPWPVLAESSYKCFNSWELSVSWDVSPQCMKKMQR